MYKIFHIKKMVINISVKLRYSDDSLVLISFNLYPNRYIDIKV